MNWPSDPEKLHSIKFFLFLFICMCLTVFRTANGLGNDDAVMTWSF